MKSLNTKLILSAIGIALLATPALAQRPQHKAPQQSQLFDSATGYVTPGFTAYPNPQTHSGSAMSREMGDNTIGGTD